MHSELEALAINWTWKFVDLPPNIKPIGNRWLYKIKNKTDDVILANTYISEFSHIEHILHTAFKIKELGTLKYFLGLDVGHSREGIIISQRKYCLDLLKGTRLLASRPTDTSLDPSIKLHQDKSKPFDNITKYKILIGRLLYSNYTKPNIILSTQ